MESSFDGYGKHGLMGLLSEFGTATTDKKIRVHPHEVDLFFEPGPRASEAPAQLGLLGELLLQPTLLEPFSVQPGLERMSGCVWKLHGAWAELRRTALHRAREAKRNSRDARLHLFEQAERWRPRLVIFVPTATRGFVRSVCLTDGRANPDASKVESPGLYYSARLYRTSLVVCDRLPTGARTLFIRLLFGRGETLFEAWREFHARYEGLPLHRYMLRQAKSYSIYLDGLEHLKSIEADQKKENQMLWCMVDRDYYGEKVEKLQNTIDEKDRILERIRSEAVEREAQLLAEQEARLRVEQEARLRVEQERRSTLEQLLLERFPERVEQLGPVLEHVLRLSMPLAVRTVMQQSWEALCRNATLEVVRGV